MSITPRTDRHCSPYGCPAQQPMTAKPRRHPNTWNISFDHRPGTKLSGRSLTRTERARAGEATQEKRAEVFPSAGERFWVTDLEFEMLRGHPVGQLDGLSEVVDID